MKRVIYIWLIASTILLSNGCIDISWPDPEPAPTPEIIKICYEIIDEENGNIINDAYVSLNIKRMPSGAYYTYTNPEEENGVYCFSIKETSVIQGLFVGAKDYKTICWYPYRPGIVKMKHLGYLKIHIKNISPYNDRDVVWVTTKPTSSCMTEVMLNYDGQLIDTVIVRHIPPGKASISWTWWKNSTRYESDTHEIEVESRDTSYFEINY
ncbi:hypothetical protein [Plebeiibacterium sediminum]|uniref:Uncharacterized protein n=1 Tax=Plebeiibacterium sediminum TaxID=2992112 RepID=A0AAE3M532_9BACT|nr:hypothetical protein [Plebeiobacterium sediminum]MCW3787223.1 hypothetical protein [Plebeiobacterium sediminum]